jgi:threonine/homoserine/homoserine lactone efflux protein
VETTFSFVMSGVVFGLAAGLAPGPLFALVLAHSARYGVSAGCKVAVSPLVSDAPIILLCLLAFTRLVITDPMLGVVALAGSTFLIYLALETFGAVYNPERNCSDQMNSLVKGAITNLLNPHPYLFWLTIGVPTLVKAGEAGHSAVIGFVVAMYSCLVGSKILIAIATGSGGSILTGRLYRVTLRFLSVALGTLALFFFRDALRYLGIV